MDQQPLPKRPRNDYDVPVHHGPREVHRPQPAGVNGVNVRPAMPAATELVADSEPPPSRAADWDSLVAMMSVIHAMVEKIYQAMSMLRDAEVNDRQQWLAYAQRQREEAEQDMSGRAAKVFSSAMAEAEKAVQSRAQEVVYQQQHKSNVALPSGVPHGQEAVVAGEPAGIIAGPRQVGEGDEIKRHEGPFRGHEDDGGENQVCWNCGREATETCSRCKKARYCGVFCQRRDWRVQHHVQCRPPEDTDEAAQAAPNAPVKITEHGQAHVQPAGLPREDTQHGDRHPA